MTRDCTVKRLSEIEAALLMSDPQARVKPLVQDNPASAFVGMAR